MPSVEIVTIGTEILLGQLLDTNAPYVARALADAGVDVFAKHSVGDNAARLCAMLEGALARADGVVTTGGLGPTVDDLTKEAVAAAVGVKLELHEPSLRNIEARFRAFGRPMTENNRRQALLPQGAVVFENPHGTAPGFAALRADGTFIACMPGVPREMKPMLEDSVMPWLRKRYGLHGGIFTRTLHTAGIGESELDRRVEDLFRSLENPKIAMLAHEGRVDVKIMAKAADERAARAMIAPVEAAVRERIGSGIFGVDEDSLEGAIVRELAARGLTLGTAESITGGGLADAIVRVPGASAVFRGGVVAYDNGLKTQLLGVPQELLEAHGAVSAEVAQAMAEGARAVLQTGVALATTGIAGPSGATAEEPVGLVYFGLATQAGTVVRRATFPGTRADVRQRSVMTALNLLWRHLESGETAASQASLR